MIRTFINTYKVSFAEEANTFIYFLKKIPFIGKKFSDELYNKTNIKLTLGIISEVFGILFKFVGKIIYVFLMIILATKFLIKGDYDKHIVYLQIFFFLSLFMGPLLGTMIFDSDKKVFNMINLMRVNARDYYLSQIIYIRLADFIFFVPAILIMGVPFLKAILLLIEFTSLRFIVEAIGLYIYDKKKKIICKKTYFFVGIFIIGLAAAYLLPYLGYIIDFNKILFNLFIFLCIAILGTLSFLYLWKYKRYTRLAKEYITKDKIFISDELVSDINFSDVEIDENKIEKSQLISKVYEDKEGYEYLNSLFFLRHRKIMVNSIKIRVVIIGILCLIAIITLFFMPNLKIQMVDAITISTPLMVFIMYTISTTERICKAMFYNCDKSLLRYSYYTEGKVILSNFTSRLKKIVSLNIIPAIALCVAFIILIIWCGQASSLIKIIPTLICIICLSAFFSIHHLFMYYVIQPYTSELTIKSPTFKVVNWIVYILSYRCLHYKTSSYYFSIGVSIATIIYMIIALIVIYKVAPKTFKLK
ncbi:MAG: hypothetical protein E6940_13125 [Clostridium septicum]|uniref:hypothetical protein n=1 Tax=Clostridium septicum TaxID=1504 RepID=UPI00258A02DD|nr:hypothetical protein [Clostridium septicum]MDU1314985.1 hypothetical protein [Clostridium septicum]WLF70960.1 hypothetical protein Q6375_08270 [Clostridium septicum]